MPFSKKITMSAVADERAAASAALDSANERLAALCQSHSATFVAVEKRNQKIAESLKSLLEKLPETDTTKDALQQNALGDLTERHRIRRRTLLQHASLLELLELPVILDACVRSQMYDEALQIAAFSTQQLHSHDSPIIQNVVKEIKHRQNDLRHHLLARFKSTVSMPECLEVITAIRRLNTIELEHTMENLEHAHEMSEYKLAVDFLEARDVWLESGTNQSTALMDAMEAYRTRVFAIATQYNAIFPSYENLLALWLSRRIQRYLGLLESLDSCVEIRDAVEAVLFFGSSLGRLGAEFTAMLDLKPALVKTVTAPWKQAVHQLATTLQICRDASAVSPLQSDAVVSATEEDEDDTNPPKIIMRTPPLARLVNGILEGLNELRRCLLPDSIIALRRELNAILTEAADTLKEHQRAAFGNLRQNAALLSDFFRTIVDPYCRGALETTLGFDVRAKIFYNAMRDGVSAATKTDETEEGEQEKEPKAEEDTGAVEDTPDGEEEVVEDEDAQDDSKEEETGAFSELGEEHERADDA